MKIDIRNFILDNMSEIKKMMLSESQTRIVRAVAQRYRFHGMRTAAYDLSVETGVSINCASSKLKNLYNMGWLNREKNKDPTGGYYYVYFADF